MKTKTILFAAGGTGGHILPALAVSKKLNSLLSDKKELFSFEFCGGGGELELEIYKKNNISYLIFPATGVIGKGFSGLLSFIRNFFKNFVFARKIFIEKNVAFVIGFGGYPSIVPILAAASMSIPNCIFEQNGLYGRANTFLSLFTKKVFAVPYARGLVFKKSIKALNPIREELRIIPQWQEKEKVSDLNILVLGGSQGAVSLNTAIIQTLNTLSDRGITIRIQTGNLDYDRVLNATKERQNVYIYKFIDDMPNMLAQADLVICRAGAGTVSEITYSRRPTIFVPLAIAGGHQKYNCDHLVKAGAALLFEQDSQLVNNLENFFKTLEIQSLSNMNKKFSDVLEISGIPDAAELISDYVCRQLS